MTTTPDHDQQPATKIDFGYRILNLVGPLKARLPVRTVVVIGVAVLAALVLLTVSLMVGARFISLPEVLATLQGRTNKLLELYVIQWRMPRAVSAIVVGALLGCSGAIFQTLTRNPLGSPDIIGFTTGAHTGGTVMILLVGTSYASIISGSMVGGLLTAAVVMLLARRGRTNGFRLIIVGIALTAMLASLNTYLILTADLDLAIIATTWGIGSLNGVAWKYAGPSLVLGIIALLAALPLSRPLAQLDLGDDAAQALGSRPEATKVAAILVGVLQVAVATTVAGPVAFVALAAPQIARRLARSQGTPMAPATAVGAALLLGADLLAQFVIPDHPLPVGLVTVSVGGLYLLYLIVGENRKGTL